MIKYAFFIILFTSLTSNVFGFEVNTHENISKHAVMYIESDLNRILENQTGTKNSLSTININKMLKEWIEYGSNLDVQR